MESERQNRWVRTGHEVAAAAARGSEAKDRGDAFLPAGYQRGDVGGQG